MDLVEKPYTLHLAADGPCSLDRLTMRWQDGSGLSSASLPIKPHTKQSPMIWYLVPGLLESFGLCESSAGLKTSGTSHPRITQISSPNFAESGRRATYPLSRTAKLRPRQASMHLSLYLLASSTERKDAQVFFLDVKNSVMASLTTARFGILGDLMEERYDVSNLSQQRVLQQASSNVPLPG
ncbi:hypothetical protein SUNI508_08032 [Seiridium unicorne]|uniref:Uncharacterized protein n=1 Tax=Seiridium unicorne TaxID=138068 RepID=A0ABR2UW22_9PEZI